MYCRIVVFNQTTRSLVLLFCQIFITGYHGNQCELSPNSTSGAVPGENTGAVTTRRSLGK